MKQSLRINRLPSNSEIRNRSIYNQIITEICQEIGHQRLVPMDRVWIDFIWVEKNHARLPSSIAAIGREMILDCLAKCRVLDNNQWISVIGFSDHFSVSSKDPHVKIVLDDLETITQSKTSQVFSKKTI